MVNLLSNAMKFSPVNSIIVVSLIQIVEGQKLKSCDISVKDEGIGISAEEQANIFKPFFQTND